MTEEFKKWLCVLGGDYDYSKLKELQYHGDFESNILSILIKAMWAINREGKWAILMWNDYIEIFCIEKQSDDIDFFYKDYNNSELKVLTKAIEYIWEHTK